MKYKITAVGPGAKPDGHEFQTDDPGEALTQLRAFRQLLPGASVRVEMESGQEVKKAKLERLRAERDAADRQRLRGRNA
jgi:hypothetical protein